MMQATVCGKHVRDVTVTPATLQSHTVAAHNNVAQQNSGCSLTVALEADAVVPLPCGSSAGSQLVGCMTLVSQTPVLLACACQATQLTVLVHWVDDPVDACILQSSMFTPEVCLPWQNAVGRLPSHDNHTRW